MKRINLICAIVAVMIAVVFITCDSECDLPHSCVHLPSAAATCTTAQTCNACGATIIAALGHDWEADSAPTLEPTCLEEGEGAFHCARIGCDETDQHHVINALGHTHVSETGVCPVDGCGALTYKIGDEGPGGGIIYYSVPDGFEVQMVNAAQNYTAYYLEVSHENARASSQWGTYVSSNGTLINGVTTFTTNSDDGYTLIGNGRKDTQLIVTYLTSISESSRAAQWASNYRSSYNDTLDDWFLPSLQELYLLYQSGSSVSGITTGNFWSSSQYDKDKAWYISLLSGTREGELKGGGLIVRPIRAF